VAVFREKPNMVSRRFGRLDLALGVERHHRVIITLVRLAPESAGLLIQVVIGKIVFVTRKAQQTRWTVREWIGFKESDYGYVTLYSEC
jgi:hypothetical protein